jgi:peroxidase
MLKTTDSVHGPLLPDNEGGFANAPSQTREWFLAGDVRANEQVALTSIHTLFVREHNHWAKQFRESNPAAPEDEVYGFARMIVGAEIQRITYREFLPVLLGPHAVPPYRGYKKNVDPTISNGFATAAYRFGHSLLPVTILRLNEKNQTADEGNLDLASAFFNPSLIADNGIETLLRGLAGQ